MTKIPATFDGDVILYFFFEKAEATVSTESKANRESDLFTTL